MPVHYGGVGCAMERILATARRHGVAVVEEIMLTACLRATTANILGTFGCMATQSFQSNQKRYVRRRWRAANQ